MTDRTHDLTDDAIARFLRARSADPDIGLVDEIVRTAEATPQVRPWLGLGPVFLPRRTLLIVVSALLLAAMGAIGVGSRLLQSDPLVITFGGTWISTSDADGGTQTMNVQVSDGGIVEITVHDTIASVCALTPSTMTGSGAIEDGARIVIPQPTYTCDDGSQAVALSGGPLEELLRNWTMTHDPQTGVLTDNVGGVWHREGAALPSPEPSARPPITEQMWPQASLDEVTRAQALADAGDPVHPWQIDPQLASLDYPGTWNRLRDGEVELVDRFLREVLGWEAYIQNGIEGGADASLADQRFLRCAPGQTNPLYPDETCAPTIDELTYESVSLDLVQPVRQDPGGIWVVSNWRSITFEQVDPRVAEAQATARLEQFLAARIAGRGAEGYVDVYADWVDRTVPLLYATSSGAPYERFEFERTEGPGWPYGGYISFGVRLFADDGATVVEQRFQSHWDGGRSVGIVGGLATEGATIENGQPVPMLHQQFDGDVTYLSPSTSSWSIGDRSFDDAFIDFTDPAAFWSDCEQPPAPADARGFAEALLADPDFETGESSPARVGGAEALVMDVVLAPDGRVCGPFRTDVRQWINSLEPGKRMRLILVDVPDGLSMRVLAITVMAPEARFDEVIQDATPLIESIEFHPDDGAPSGDQ